MSKKILFLSKGEKASSTRYRALQYFPLYENSGFHAKHITISGGITPFLVALYHASKSDVVILIRKTFPSPFFWLLRQFSKKLIFDFDDAIFCNTDGTYSKTRMSRFKGTVEKCDHVFAGNEYLADTAKEFQPYTSTIPTSLDTKKYNQIDVKKSNNFVLVWIGSRSTKKYITGIIPAIEMAAKTIPNLQLKIIADFELHSESFSIINTPWAEKSEAIEINSSDVGLAPLPSDSWTKGKCALKVLQYMAASIPVISSPTSVNGYVIEHSKSGYLAQDEAEWVKYITIAYQEKSRLKEMGLFGQNRVSKEFDINIIFKKIITQLEMI
jgi:glycosyltransferase involved in cell wall biosynthesis